jgi:TonB-linked SusC/RagA family outer membrane protein
MKWAKGLSLVAALAVPALTLTRPLPVGAQTAQPQQTGRVSGIVTESTTGRPIAGVNVVVVGTQLGTQTDADGRFSLRNLPVGSREVRVQRIGFAPATRTVVVSAGQTVAIDFQMAAQAVQLQSVVTVGYGTQERRDITGAVASVATEALEHAPVTSIDQVLQGTAPGVQVTTASSEPGGALSIRVRGTSSITGNSEPLYVIDGFPIENDIEGSSVGNGGRSRTTPSNPLVTLNPSDIESISILKDASSTAIYGARGANGVVIITTKQGRGTKPVFSLDYYTGTQKVAKTYDLLDAKGYMDYANAFGAASSTPYTPFPDSTYQRLLASGINTNWQDELFRTAPVQNFQLGVRGATNAASPTRYNLSGGVFNQDGIVLGSGLRRLSSRLNVNQAVGSRVEFSGSFTASNARSKSVPSAGQQNANAGAISAALQYVPILPVLRPDGTYSYINTDLNAYNAALDAPQTPNPISLAREVQDSLSDTRLLGNLTGTATLLEGLKFKVSLGADYADRWRNTYYPRTTLRGSQSNGEAIRSTAVTSSWLNENTLNYDRKFGDAHSLSLLGGYSRQRTDVDGANMSNTNFVSDITGYFDIGAGTQQGGPAVSSRRSTQTLESYLSRANYTLLDRYLLTLTYRADGSSRFAKNKKWGAFPSAAIGWRLSDEPFLKGVSQLDELKLRLSYGLAGNPSIRPYQSLARLNDQGYSFGGTAYSGYYPVAVGNPDLTWETTRQTDYGLDLGFLERFTVTADYYAKRTSNLLLNISLPFETGFTSALANRGKVDNRGFELGLDARLVDSKKSGAFTWRANVNFATNRNKVIDLGGQASISADLITTDYNLPGSIIQVGKPIGMFYGFKSLGILRDTAAAKAVTWKNFNNSTYQPGNMLIADIDGDGVITLADRTDIGNPTPKWTGGLTNTFGYKGFELTGLVQASHGGVVLNVNRIRTESSPRVNVIADRYYDAWTPTHTDAKYPKIGENPNQVGTNNFTDNLLEDASYVRLRTLTLSYVLNKSLQARTRLSGGRVYVTGTNLWTSTDYSGFDPDVSAQSVGNANRGIDIGAYPLARTVTFGLSVNY